MCFCAEPLVPQSSPSMPFLRPGTTAGKTCAVVMLMLALSSHKNQPTGLAVVDSTAIALPSDPSKVEPVAPLDESAPVTSSSEILSAGLKQVAGLAQVGLEWLPSRLQHGGNTVGSFGLLDQDKLLLEQSIARAMPVCRSDERGDEQPPRSAPVTHPSQLTPLL
jgi:hypothetical protein